VVRAAFVGPALWEELERLARTDLPIAEINRRFGELAWSRDLVRPSYSRVRQLVHEVRERRPAPSEPSWGALLLEVDLGARPPVALVERIDRLLP
jgi:hypothetical protein